MSLPAAYVFEEIPGKQGLKHYLSGRSEVQPGVFEEIPGKQGLKLGVALQGSPTLKWAYEIHRAIRVLNAPRRVQSRVAIFVESNY